MVTSHSRGSLIMIWRCCHEQHRANKRQITQHTEQNHSMMTNISTNESKLEAEVDRLTKKLSITEDKLSDAREWLDERYKATSEADERAEKAEAELERIYAGMQGSCYCCEPVGIMNQKLEAEVERLRNEVEKLKCSDVATYLKDR